MLKSKTMRAVRQQVSDVPSYAKRGFVWARDFRRRSLEPPEQERSDSGFTEVDERSLGDAIDVTRASYREVQTFYFRIDEKLRSLVTALAFLTASGITLFIFGASDKAADLRFDGRSWNAANIFFLFFLGTVALSLSSALVALDPTTHRPHFLGAEAPNTSSVIYFDALVRGDHADWWRTGERPIAVRTAQERLLASYRSDAYAIARRTRHKAQRSQNAEALMSVAIVALLLLGITRLPQSTAGTREKLIVVCLVAFTFFPLLTMIRMTLADLPALAWRDLSRRNGTARQEAPVSRTAMPRRLRYAVRAMFFYVLPPAAATALGYLSISYNRAEWPTIFFAFAWLTVGRLASYWNRGHWIGALGSVAGAALVLIVVFSPGTFWSGTILVDNSEALRPENGAPHQIVCVRVRGKPEKDVRVLVTANGIGGASVHSARTLSLDRDGVGTKSFDLGKAGRYHGAIDVRKPPHGDFVHVVFTVPSSANSELERPFRCP